MALSDEKKRDRYAIDAVSVALIRKTGCTVLPDPRPDVPGHVLIPEINSTSFKTEKRRFRSLFAELAVEASANILRRPLI